jgi:DNA-directed RNA polymerase specialized sigma24 family protein
VSVQTEPDRPEGFEELPASVSYREVAAEHGERVYGYAMLLLGEQPEAEEVTRDALRRLWQTLDAGNVFGDAEELLYRHATRAAIQRRNRNHELRGWLPATSADDRQITAFGILDSYNLQQRAAVLLAAWAKVGYRIAGVGTGVGEARCRDLAFSARQEYREERGGPKDALPSCPGIIPFLSARVDEELSEVDQTRVEAHLAECPSCPSTAALFEEYSQSLRSLRIPPPETPIDDLANGVMVASPRRRQGFARRLMGLSATPAALVVVLILGLFIFNQAEPSIKTGGGRTSDIAYARDPSTGVVVAVDTGKGSAMGRLPAGALTASGGELYSAEARCSGAGGSCTTTIRVTDTATLQPSDVARLEGRFAVVAVDEEGHRLFLADEARNGERLEVLDLTNRRSLGSVEGPAGVERPFAPTEARVLPNRQFLVTLGGGANPAVVETDLGTLQARAVPLERAAGGKVALAPMVDGSGVYAYTGDAVYEVWTSPAPAARRDPRISNPLIGRWVELGAPGNLTLGEGALAAAADGTVYLVREQGIGIVPASQPTGAVANLQTIATDRQFRSVSVASDGKSLYTIQTSGSYSVLDPANGQELLPEEGSGGFFGRPRRERLGILSFLQVNMGE